jgi:ribosome-binding factor A
MESIRQQKVSRLLQKELGEMFRAESKNLFGGAFITVTTVRVSPDLGVAKVYLSVLQASDRNKVLENVKSQLFAIKRIVSPKLKSQLRIIPEMTFFIDDSLDYAMRIEELLKK